MTQFGDLVTLVNRTARTTLTAVWDGQQYHFPPGDNPNVPLVIAEAAYRQNPLHGSEDPLGDPQFVDSLFGIKGAKLPFGTVARKGSRRGYALSADSKNNMANIAPLLRPGKNSVAAVVFMLVAWDQIYWGAVLLLAVGALLGGVVGAGIGRRLPPGGLRVVIVVVGLVAIVRLLA